MKTAKKQIVTVELYCPHCGAIIVSPGGPHAWDVHELTTTVRCFECDKESKTPRV